MTYQTVWFLPRDVMLAPYMLSSCDCLSVTVCHKPSLYQNTQTTPHDSTGTLICWCQRSRRNSDRITPTGRPIEMGSVTIGDFRPIIPMYAYMSETVQDRDIVTIERLLEIVYMRCIEWLYFKWPSVTRKYPKTTPISIYFVSPQFVTS